MGPQDAHVYFSNSLHRPSWDACLPLCPGNLPLQGFPLPDLKPWFPQHHVSLHYKLEIPNLNPFLRGGRWAVGMEQHETLCVLDFSIYPGGVGGGKTLKSESGWRSNPREHLHSEWSSTFSDTPSLTALCLPPPAKFKEKSRLSE